MIVVNDCMIQSDHAMFVVRRCDKSHQEQRLLTATEFALLLQSYGLVCRLRYGVGNVHNRAFNLADAGEQCGKVRHVFDKTGRLVAKFKPVS